MHRWFTKDLFVVQMSLKCYCQINVPFTSYTFNISYKIRNLFLLLRFFSTKVFKVWLSGFFEPQAYSDFINVYAINAPSPLHNSLSRWGFYPLPGTHDCLEALMAVYFNIFLESCYLQVPVNPADWEKTLFVFQFWNMLLGLYNAGACLDT